MFVVKVNGVPWSVLSSYQHAAWLADMIRGRGKKISITALPAAEAHGPLRSLNASRDRATRNLLVHGSVKVDGGRRGR
jgi:hypothetical protein